MKTPETPKTIASDQTYPVGYAPIPANGKTCCYTGLKHAHLYKLLTKSGAATPYVRVAQIRQPGAPKGVTLFNIGDMLRYIDWLAASQGSGHMRSITEQIMPPPVTATFDI